jgi:hypothetical protein
VPNTIATAADSDVVAKQALATLIPPVDSSKPFDDVAKRKRLEAFETVYRARLKTMPVYPAEMQASKDPNLDARLGFVQSALLDNLKPTPAALDALGQQRAQRRARRPALEQGAQPRAHLHRGEAHGSRRPRARCAWR